MRINRGIVSETVVKYVEEILMTIPNVAAGGTSRKMVLRWPRLSGVLLRHLPAWHTCAVFT